MRHEKLRTSEAEALRLLGEASVVHLATTRPDGAPVLRALNAVVVDGWVLFHGAKAGEKSQCLGRPAVVSAERTVASIPSYFTDPRHACPATTLYVSAQASGVLCDVDDVELKARMLGALMEKYQPEGGYETIRSSDPEYAARLRGVRVFGLAIETLDGKAKLGQHKPPEYARLVLEGLWRRGAPGDADAIRTLCDALVGLELPTFLQGPDGTRFDVALRDSDLPQVVDLLAGQYWHSDSSREHIAEAQRGAQAWVGLRGPDGALLATGRAVSDGSRHAYVADVAVHAERRGRGLGRALMQCLLAHPAVRGARVVRLGTADKQRFYEALGFVEASRVDFGFPSTGMLRVQSSGP